MNFSSAAARHFRDGETLFHGQRFDNADQLFGYAAECAIKACLPARCFRDDDIEDRFRVHINILWGRVQVGCVDPKAHPGLAALLTAAIQPFQTWRTDQRYEATGSISSAACDIHRRFARRILGASGFLGSRGFA